MTTKLLAACLGASAALVFSASAANAGIDLTTLTLNGNAAASINDLNLANDTGGLASSGFIATPISSNSYISGSFDFTLVDTASIAAYGAQADGIAFVIQNDPAGASALGGGGGNIGAAGIANSIGIGFQSWYNDHATIFQSTDIGCGVVYCGTGALGNFSLGQNPRNDVHVTFNYSGGILSYTATNSDTSQSISDSLTFYLPALGPQVYLGFTGATGLGYANQDVSNVVFNVSPAPEPAAWATMLLGLGLAGAALRRRTVRA